MILQRSAFLLAERHHVLSRAVFAVPDSVIGTTGFGTRMFRRVAGRATKARDRR